MITFTEFHVVKPRQVPFENFEKRIMNLASYEVDHECSDNLGNPITGKERSVLIWEKAYDMTIGSNHSKYESIIIGAATGVVIALTTFWILQTRKSHQH